VNHATESILTRDLPEAVGLSVPLSVLVMYPDYPCPPGTNGIEEATRVWQGRLERALASLHPAHEFLLVTIRAFSWELPAPSKGYVGEPLQAQFKEPQ
jgi:hypothetical protein